VTDQLDDLFADLRAETLVEVRPPGVTAARRTVHRRRTTKTVGVTAFVVVAAAGSIGSHLLGSMPFAQPGGPDPATLAKRQSRAAAVAGLDPDVHLQTPRSMQGIAAAGFVATGLLAAGTYTLRFACDGPGRVTVLFRVRQAADGTTDVVGSAAQQCGAPRAATKTFTLAENTEIEAELRPDGTATDRSGYAFTLNLAQDDLQRLSQEVIMRQLTAAWANAISGTSGPTTAQRLVDQDGTLKPGKYLLRYLCSGVGRVAVTVSVRSGGDSIRESSGTAACGSAEPVQTLSFEIRADDILTVSVEPDQDALGQAAYAKVLARA
jgi:hypothetical protein